VLPAVGPPDSLAPALPTRDSILALALQRRPELAAALRHAAAAEAEARAARRERLPVPVATAGWKTEQTTTGGGRLGGFVAGISVPLAVFDRRAGAVGAADAEGRRRLADVDATRRRIVREAEDAYAAVLAVEDEVARLGPGLDADAAAALRAAEAAYTEGEITLVEWLDAVRAYHEAATLLATLRAETRIRRAALARATGGALLEEHRP
jgi:cobalt-zinc-cadmium efflux system outer membrane protein